MTHSSDTAFPTREPLASSVDAPGAASSVPAGDFAAAFRRHPAGVAVITADSGTGPVAMTATSVSSISADPPLLMFSLSDLSSSSPAIREAETIVVHLLEAEQVDLAKLGATSGIDRFADTAIWSRLATGEPYFLSARTWIRGHITHKIRAGTSVVVIVEAEEIHLPTGGDSGTETAEAHPLVYCNRGWHHLGDHSQII